MPVLLVLAMVLSWSPGNYLKNYILEHYPWDRVEVESVKYEGNLPAQRPVNIIIQRGPVGRAVFLLEFPDGTYKKVYAKVDAQQTVVRAVRPLRRGTVLKREDLYMAPANVLRMPKNALTSMEDAVGKVLKRSVRSGAILTEALVVEKPLIHKGQKVIIVYEKPGLRLTAPGVAREDGYRGSSIQVMNLWSKRIMIGFVQDSSTVNITP
ncbi:MAG: flagellar basal body P-ring formation protein FlgA [Nitrospirae bacterium]|nr:flagellar basal body P-ring formation protein FlgA [Nitrospirota bacterium]